MKKKSYSLNPFAAEIIFHSIQDNGIALTEDVTLSSSSPFYKLENRLLITVKKASYPSSFRREHASIDQDIAVALHEELNITPSIAADIGFWRFLNCVSFPHIVYWRWNQGGLLNKQRFLDRTRNYLGNLWWRAELLRSSDSLELDPWIALKGLLEDDFIGILERPTLRGYREIIRSFANRISQIRSRVGISGETANSLIRSMIVNLRIHAGSHHIHGLTNQERESLMDYIESLSESKHNA